MNNNTSRKTTFWVVILIILVIISGVLVYKRASHRNSPLVFSPQNMLQSLWREYKANYLEKGTLRTLDKQQNNITTSEGQSYTMLRAVWMDDQETFDKSYQWTIDNLRRKEDHLFSWLFGKRADGTYGVLVDRGGYNSASDADSDIALALILANNRWHQPHYIDDARTILKDMWEKEVVTINGVPYLTANNVEKFTSQKVIINPSYFSPYAYRIFAEVDPLHPWMRLVDSSYDLLNKVTEKLPPDWIVMDKTTGVLAAPDVPGLTTNFSFDALRIPWRIALDYEWNKEPRAKAYLDKLSFLSEEWRKKKMIGSSYKRDGTVIDSKEVFSEYGGTIGYFMVSDPRSAEEVYARKLKALYNPDTDSWKKSLGYYDDNWVWFGLGLYNHLIQPLQ